MYVLFPNCMCVVCVLAIFFSWLVFYSIYYLLIFKLFVHYKKIMGSKYLIIYYAFEQVNFIHLHLFLLYCDLLLGVYYFSEQACTSTKELTAHLCEAVLSVASQQQLKISLGRVIYTTKIGKFYKSELYFFKMKITVKHFLAHY